MANYAVGDIQGCLKPLKALLQQAKFNPRADTLWVCGDLVNRGAQSLETLRFIMALPSKNVVLGNHDLHLLAVAKGKRNLNKKDTLSTILQAEDREAILSWLHQQPLIHHDAALGYTMVHAGIPHIWSLEKAKGLSREVENVLRNNDSAAFLSNMYGNTPVQWHDSLTGYERLRAITNYLTRMRFCDDTGKLDLETKTDIAPPGFDAWFRFDNHMHGEERIIFGHWASLAGITGKKNVIGLDTGCVWGGKLTLMRLEDQKKYCVTCDC